MRAKLIDWMFDVAEAWKLTQFTFVLAISILDVYCSIVSVTRETFQAVGCMALSLASSVLLMYSSEIADFVKVTQNEYTEEQFIKIRDDMVEKLEGNIIRPFTSLFFKGTDTKLNFMYLNDAKFNLTYASLFVDLTMYKSSTIASVINYMLDATAVGTSLNTPADKIADICIKIVTKAKYNLVSELPNSVKNAKFVLAILKKQCPAKLQEITNKLTSQPLKYKKQLKPFEGYTKVGTVGSGVRGDAFKVLKDKKHYVVKRGDLEELAILRLLTHSSSAYISKLEGIIPEGDNAFLFLELGQFNLATAVKKEGFSMNGEKNILRHFTDMLKGVVLCHDYNVIHADLKPENVVWFGDVKGKKGNFKLIDFGAAQAFCSQKKSLRPNVSTPTYKAPEMFLAPSKYSYKVDVWNLGCILYFMCTTKALIYEYAQGYSLINIIEVLGAPTEESWPGVTSLPEWSSLYSSVKSDKSLYFNILPPYVFIRTIIDQCLIFNPADRPSSKKLLSCFLKEIK